MGGIMSDIATVILAAGKSSRMKSALSKVVHPLAGKPVISYVIDAAVDVSDDNIIVVSSSKQRDLNDYLDENDIECVFQTKALGTGHAVKTALKSLQEFNGYILVLCGDVPLIQSQVLNSFVSDVKNKKSMLGVLTMIVKDPGSYGRIIRDLDGRIIKIVEAKEASEDELAIKEVNSGVLCFDCAWLKKAIKRLSNVNSKGEYYLTDLIGIALKEHFSISGYVAPNAHDFIGINDRVDMANARDTLKTRINKHHMQEGIGIWDYSNTHIDVAVTIGVDTEIMPYSFILGSTVIGTNCLIENGVTLNNVILGDNVHIKAHSHLDNCTVDEKAVIGPFARIRPQTKIGKHSKIGNFVEIKKCELKPGVKASHLSYLGDATIGADVNIGCGTITCNYDGTSKHHTTIGDRVFVGSDTQFIAPVSIGKGATIGAGSTITDDVAANTLALSRSEQKVVKGWKRREKK